MSVALNTKHLSSFISEEEYAAIYPQVEAAHNQLEAKSGPGNDFLGWMYLPRDYDKEEFARIKEAAAKIREDSDVLVVPGSSFACPGYVRLAYCVSYEQIERSLPAFKEIAEEYGLCK